MESEKVDRKFSFYITVAIESSILKHAS